MPASGRFRKKQQVGNYKGSADSTEISRGIRAISKVRQHKLRKSFPPAIPLALGTDVIPQHRAEDEVFFRRQLIQWARHHTTDGVDALRLAEKEVDFLSVNGLDEVIYVLLLQPGDGKSLVLAVHRIEHHLAHTFLKLIDVVQEDFQFGGLDIGL